MMRPFNLSKISRRDPSLVFNPTDSLFVDPYRKSKGKPNSGAGDDLLRPGEVGGGPLSQNKDWPSDQPFITDSEENPKRDNGTGLSTDFGVDLHDDYEGQSGSSGSDAVLGKNETVTRRMDPSSRDRPFNLTDSGVLKSVRKRLRNI